MSCPASSNASTTVSSLLSLFPWITLTMTASLHFTEWVDIRKPSWIYNMQVSVEESEKPSLRGLDNSSAVWILFIPMMSALCLLSEFIILKDMPELIIKLILIIKSFLISYCPLYSLFQELSLVLCYKCFTFLCTHAHCFKGNVYLLTHPYWHSHCVFLTRLISI